MVTPPAGTQIVQLTPQSAEVHLGIDGPRVLIGTVGLAAQHWWWEHCDGERSSPVAQSCVEAVVALAEYHRRFKHIPRSSVRHLLFEAS